MSTSTRGGRPHPIEAERAVIGAVMRDNCILPGLPIRLRPEHFSVARHQAIWRAVLDLIDAGQRVNPSTLGRALVDDDKVVDLRPDLAFMVAEAAVPDFVDQYAAHIVSAFVERHVAQLQEDHDRLNRTLPGNVSNEAMGAYLFVRCADIVTQACDLSVGGRHLGGVDLDVVMSLISEVLDMVEGADAEASS